MVKDMLFGKEKTHRKNCQVKKELEWARALPLLVSFCAFFFVFLVHKYFYSIPPWLAALFVILFVWYLLFAFFRLALFHKKDRC
ncbi:hypothetical protein GF342_02965 [Candidatus Woesearchaeota archaeon]|nr:hypothetical protein [Candidatus Woesearchaeota archaeon]